jgi:AcrR family transcriptional regulator
VNRPIQHKPEKILAAAQSVFADEGVGVSTAKIAAAAGVSNGTLFNYFPTKQALIDALYVSIKTNLGEAVGEFDDTEPIEGRMRQVWNRWFRWASQNRDAHLVMNLLRQAGLASAEAQATGNAAILGPVRVLNQAKDSGVLVDLPLEHLAALVQHHLDQAVASELDDRQAELAFHVLWNGITEQPNTSLVKDSS